MASTALSSTIGLPPDASFITYNVPTTPTPTQQPHTTPIAHFQSTANDYPTGSLIAISKSYIVYVVKNGLVRVIDRQKALRTLLRGHTKRVTDLAFFSGLSVSGNPQSNGSDVLGTVGGEGDSACVLVWRIFAKVAPPGEGGQADGIAIGSEKMLEVRYKPSVRILWNPLNPNHFLLMNRNNVEAANYMGVGGGGVIVNTTKLATGKHVEGHAVCVCGENGMDLGHGGIVLWHENFGELGCLDMAWSKWSTSCVVMCGGGADIVLWDWKSGGRILSVLPIDEEGVDVIDSVTFVYQIDGVVPSFDKDSVKRYLTEPFLTGTKGNTQIILWSNFQTLYDGITVGANKLRILEMGYSHTSFLMSGCSGALSVFETPKAYVVLADRNSGSLFAIHIGTEKTDEYKVATGFDSITPFQIMHPILSWIVMGEMVIDDQEEEDEEDERGGGEKFELSLFCVQSKAVQMLKLKPKMLRKPKLEKNGILDLPSNIFIQENNSLNHAQDEQQIIATQLDATHYEYEDDNESLEDEGTIDEISDSDEGTIDEISEEKEETQLLPSVKYPPPPGLTSTTKTNDSTSFSNWLGAIASETMNSSIQSASQNDEQPTNGNDMTSRETNPPTGSNNPALPNILDQKQNHSHQQMFLSPVELISSSSNGDSHKTNSEQSKPKMATTSSNDKAPARNPSAPKTAPSRKKSPRRQSPKRASYNESKSKKSSSPPPPKIHILRREQPLPPETSSNAMKSPPVDSANIEDIVKRTLHNQLKMHEANIISEVQRYLKSETKSILVPSLTKNLLQGMEQSVSKPLQSSMTKSLKDREKKLIKEVVDGVCVEVKDATTKAFQQSMRKVLIPAYEAGTQQMFSQISSQISSTLASAQRDSNNDNQKLIENLTAQISSLSNQVSSLSSDLANLRNMIQSQNIMTSNQTLGSLPSPSNVHDPIQTLQEEIMALISETNYSVAFTKALSANSVEIAVFCCKNADISFLLDNDNSVLSQPILLCLMQQLGSVLTLKQFEANVWAVVEWLQDIAVSINPMDASIKNHVGDIMKGAMNNIHEKLNSGNIDSKLRRKLQMLLQVIRGVRY